jgi:TPR repeat protein
MILLYQNDKISLNDEYEKNHHYSFAAYKSGGYETALGEWMPLAKQGDADAQYNLGVAYLQVEGDTENYVKSHMWANIARYNGYENTKEFMEFLVAKMTQKQIAKAQDLAQECVAKDYKGC